jgi:hypothetical protein
MAKDTKDNKSESIPGGTKAGDLPASVGGTKDAGSQSQPGHAPVTTDAGAKTPAVSDTMPGPGRDTGPTSGSVFPDRDTTPTGRVSKRDDLNDDDDFGPRAGKQQESVPTVRDVGEAVRGFVSAVKARNWSAAWSAGSALCAAFGQLMDTGTLRAAVQTESAAGGAQFDTASAKLTSELESCRNDLSGIHTYGAKAAWSGGPDPTSGSPMPQGTVPVAESAAFVNPQMILVLYELVSQVWSHVRGVNARK